MLDSAPRRRALGVGLRVALHVSGVLTLAFSVAIMLWNNIGAGPLDVFIGAVQVRTGLPLTFAVYLTTGSLLAISWALGRRPGFGNLLTPLLIGPSLQFFADRMSHAAGPSHLVVQIAVHLTAIALVAVGAGALIVANLGAGTAELLTAATADQTGQPQARVRTAIEVTWLIVGAALGGPFGIGTFMVAVLIGPAVAAGYRVVDTAVGAVTRPIERLVYA